MRLKIMIKNLNIALFTLFLMMLSVTGFSQVCSGNQVTVTLANFSENGTLTQFEFDVFIKNTGTTALKLGGLQGAVIPNVGFLPSGATGTFSMITSPAGTGNFPLFNNPVPSYDSATRQMRWTHTPVTLLSGKTVNLPSNVNLLFARFRFTSSLPFTSNFAGTLTPQFNVQIGYTNVLATVYCNGNASSTPLGSATPGTLIMPNVYNVTLNPPSSIVNLKLFIQGYYTGSGTMASVANNQSGGAMTDVEMVTVELFNAALAPVASTTAMLHTNGTCQAVFTTSPSGLYYIAVRGSNSIRTWSATRQTIGTTPLTYDFSTASAKAAGGNMKNLGSGVFGFYSSDLDLPVGDGFIDLPDYSIWEADFNLGSVGAFQTDLDGDAFVDLPDYSIWEANFNAGITEIQP
jgi:hypothetical protein